MTDTVAARVAERVVERLLRHKRTGRYLADVTKIEVLPIFDVLPTGFTYAPVQLCVAAFEVDFSSRKWTTTRNSDVQVNIAVVGKHYGKSQEGYRQFTKVIGELGTICVMHEAEQLWGNRDSTVSYSGTKAIPISTATRPKVSYGGVDLSDNVSAMFARVLFDVQIDEPWEGTWT